MATFCCRRMRRSSSASRAPRCGQLLTRVLLAAVRLVAHVRPQLREVARGASKEALLRGGRDAAAPGSASVDSSLRAPGDPRRSRTASGGADCALVPGSGHRDQLLVEARRAAAEQRESSEGESPHQSVAWLRTTVTRARSCPDEKRARIVARTAARGGGGARLADRLERLERHRQRRRGPPVPERLVAAARPPSHRGGSPGLGHLRKVERALDSGWGARRGRPTARAHVDRAPQVLASNSSRSRLRSRIRPASSTSSEGTAARGPGAPVPALATSGARGGGGAARPYQRAVPSVMPVASGRFPSPRAAPRRGSPAPLR